MATAARLSRAHTRHIPFLTYGKREGECVSPLSREGRSLHGATLKLSFNHTAVGRSLQRHCINPTMLLLHGIAVSEQPRWHPCSVLPLPMRRPWLQDVCGPGLPRLFTSGFPVGGTQRNQPTKCRTRRLVPVKANALFIFLRSLCSNPM